MTASQPKNTSEAVLGCLATIFAIVISPILSGLVISILWGWFVVPLGVPAIGVAASVGLTVTVRAFTGTHKDGEKPKTYVEAVQKLVGNAIGTPIGILLVGWIITFFL